MAYFSAAGSPIIVPGQHTCSAVLLTAEAIETEHFFPPFQCNSSLRCAVQKKYLSFVPLHLCKKEKKPLLAFIVCREIMVIMSSTESILCNHCLPSQPSQPHIDSTQSPPQMINGWSRCIFLISFQIKLPIYGVGPLLSL